MMTIKSAVVAAVAGVSLLMLFAGLTLVIVLAPFMVIWSLNVLFATDIVYTLQTWVAVWAMMVVISLTVRSTG